MTLSWLSVKTLFRTQAIGPPAVVDEPFDPSIDSWLLDI